MIEKDIIFTLQDCEWRVLATIKFNYEVIIPLLKRLLPMNVTLVIAIYSFEEYHLYGMVLFSYLFLLKAFVLWNCKSVYLRNVKNLALFLKS